jgi:hypothetical protein
MTRCLFAGQQANDNLLCPPGYRFVSVCALRLRRLTAELQTFIKRAPLPWGMSDDTCFSNDPPRMRRGNLIYLPPSDC